MTKCWRIWDILDKPFPQTYFRLIDCKEINLFSFFFSNFGQNKEPWYPKYMQRLFKLFIFGSQRAQLWRKVLKCWWCGVSVECVPELRLQPRGAPASVGPHLEEKWAPSTLWSGYTLWTQKQNSSVWMNLPVWTAFSYTGPIIGMEISPSRLLYR